MYYGKQMEEYSASTNPLSNERISKLLIKYAIPSIISILVGALYNIVDQIFIGQGVGILGNAATNVAFPLTTICISISLFLGLGGASNLSLALGRDENEKASCIVGNTISLTVILGILLFIIVRIFLKPLMIAFGATKDILEYSITYTSITSFGFPILIFSSAMSSLIRADGSPRYSMISMLIGAILNTIFDPIFIFALNMGIAGAALATVIGQIVSFLLVLSYLPRFKTVNLNKASFKISLNYTKSIFALGSSGGFNQIAMMLVQITMNNVLNYYGSKSVYGGNIPIAVAGIIAKVNMIFMAFIIGMSQGSQPIIGFNYGAKNYDRVKKTYKLAITITTVIAFISFLIFQIFPREVINIFGKGDDLYYRFAERYFRIFMALIIVNGIQPVTGSFFTSIGKAFKGVFISMTRQIIFLLPLIIILPPFIGIDGIMYAGPIADGAALIIAVILVALEMKNMGKENNKKNYI